MKDLNEIVKRLMAEFTVESMLGEDLAIDGMPSLVDDPSLAALQQQFSVWCLQSKRLLLVDVVEPLTPQGMFVSHIKAKIQKYLAMPSNAGIPAMKCLYEDVDLSVLSYQIGLLASHSFYKDVPDINSVPRELRRSALDPEHVSVPIAVYTFFTLLANPNVEPDGYNKLFINSWFRYFENWTSREFLFRMNGNNWKQSFEGVLLA